jgi:hypothetical protein
MERFRTHGGIELAYDEMGSITTARLLTTGPRVRLGILDEHTP